MIPESKLLFALAPIAGGAAVMAWRWHETRSPVTSRKILIPPLGMSTGFAMFAVPQTHIAWTWGVAAFLAGALLLAVPLSRSSTLERSGEAIVMRRSSAFVWILLGLLALRLLLHDYVGHLLSPLQTAAVFFVLAFGMILRWRAQMYLRYRRLRDAPE